MRIQVIYQMIADTGGNYKPQYKLEIQENMLEFKNSKSFDQW